MSRYDSLQGITARATATVADNVLVSVWLREGTVRAAFESRRPSELGGGYEYAASTSFGSADPSVLDHESLEDALGGALADPPEEWLALLLGGDEDPEGAVWAEIRTSVIADLVRDLNSDIDRRVEEVVGKGIPGQEAS